MTRQAAVVGAIVCSLVAFGCKKQEEAQAAAAPTSEMPAGGGTVPSALTQAEELTEDVQDSINAGKWDGAQKMVTQLQSLSTQLRSTHKKTAEVAMFDSAVAVLAANVKTRNRLPADTAANRASWVALRMMESYQPRTPVAVGFMDVYARDATYKAELGDWSGVDKAISELEKNYHRVSEHVSRKDPNLNTAVKGHIDALKNAAKTKNAAQVKTASNVVLEDVDRIEKVF